MIFTVCGGGVCLVDLRPYMEKSPEEATFRKEILEECQEEDGAIYLSPSEVRFSLTQELFITKNFWRRLV